MKKVFKVIGIMLGIFIILGLIFFIIDYNRVNNNKRPIFCIENPDYIMDGGTAEFFGLGYKVIDFHTISGFDDIKIGTWFMKYEDFEKEMEKFETKIIIESDCIGIDEPREYMEIKGEEAEEIERIFKNLKFTTETCDGLDNYNITFLKDNMSYGIEIYTNCHITTIGKEAILNTEDSYKLIEIINHHRNNAVNSNTNQTNL